jgi:hypothetical protein
MRTIKPTAAAFLATPLLVSAFLTACVSSRIIIGTVRPPIDPAQVHIFLRPPDRYEEVAVLNTSSKNSWQLTAQGRTDIVIQRLKEEAAKLGANGVLLQSVGDQAVGSIGTGTGFTRFSGRSALAFGLSSSATVYVKTGEGLAIYVGSDQIPLAPGPATIVPAPAPTLSQADFGIELSELRVTSSLGIDGVTGAMVTKVTRQGVADQAGIRAGDILLRVGDVGVNEPNDVVSAVGGTVAGAVIPIELIRKARIIWVNAQF